MIEYEYCGMWATTIANTPFHGVRTKPLLRKLSTLLRHWCRDVATTLPSVAVKTLSRINYSICLSKHLKAQFLTHQCSISASHSQKPDFKDNDKEAYLEHSQLR